MGRYKPEGPEIEVGPRYMSCEASDDPLGTRFALSNLRVIRADPVGDGSHVRCIFGSEGGGRVSGIAFRASDRPIGQALLSAKFLHVAASLRVNTWGGKQEAQLFVEDVAYPDNA